MKHETLTDVLTRIMKEDSRAVVKVALKGRLAYSPSGWAPLTPYIIESYAEASGVDYILVKYLGRTEVYSNDKYLNNAGK